MPKKDLNNIMINNYKKISTEAKAAFISVFVFGIIAHLYMFTNKLPNYDDFVGINTYGATIRLGRWFLWIVGAIFQNLDFLYTMPWLNGLIMLLIVGICAVMMVDILDINTVLESILIGALLIVFPTWTCTLFFMFSVYLYAMSLFLAVLAVWLVKNDNKWFALSIVCICFSMGIYQSYVTVTATLFVLILIMQTFQANVTPLTILRKSISYMGILLGGGASYLICTKFFCWIKREPLSTYKGINGMQQFGFSKIVFGLRETISNMCSLGISNKLEMSYNLVLKFVFIVLIILSLAMCIYWFFQLLKKSKWVAVLFAFLQLCFLICINGMFFIVTDVDDIYLLMLYAYVFLLIFPVALLRNLMKQTDVKEKICVWLQWTITICLVGAIYSYVVYANGQYLSMDMSFSQAKSYYTVMLSQIKSTQGYSDDCSIMFVGEEITDDSFYDNSVMDVFDVKGRTDTYLNIWSRKDMLRYYFGFAPEYIECTEENYSDSIKKMPCYPAEGSIQNMGKTIVVKLEDLH